MSLTTGDGAMPLAAGTRLQDCQIVRLLRQDAWHCDYQARRGAGTVLLREFLPQEFACREGGAVRERDPADHNALRFWIRGVLDQAALLETVRHPGLLPCLAHFQANGTAYWVSPWIEAPTLEAVLARSAPLRPEALAPLLQPVLGALEQMHAMHLQHRDIRPHNLLLRSDGGGLLLPGCGTLRAPIRMASRVVSGIAAAGFAAPEETGSGNVGPWTDLYALAATLAHALGSTPQLPSAWHDALSWALQPAPAQRPQSVAAWRAALPLPEEEPPAAETAAPPPRTSRLKWALAPLALAGLGAGALLLRSPGHGETAAPVPAAPAPRPAAPAAAPAPAPAPGEALDKLADNLMKQPPAAADEAPARSAAPAATGAAARERELESEVAKLRAEKEALERSRARERPPEPAAAPAAAAPPPPANAPAPVAASTPVPAPAAERHTAPLLDRSQDCAQPSYPEISQRLGEQGTVKLRILVDTDGRALQTVVESSSGYDRLDQATAQALGRCRFIPGTRNGVPVQDWVRLLHVWRLDN